MGLAKYIYELFDEPASSKPALAVGMVMFIVILVSSVTFCLETLPLFLVATSPHACAAKLYADGRSTVLWRDGVQWTEAALPTDVTDAEIGFLIGNATELERE